MQTPGLPAIEIEAPVGETYPYGLLSQIKWLPRRAATAGENKANPEGTAHDPAAPADGDGGEGIDPEYDGYRWEQGVQLRPPGFVPDPPIEWNGDDAYEATFPATNLELRRIDGDWTEPKAPQVPPGYRADFPAVTLIWKERRSEMEIAVQKAHAEMVFEKAKQFYLEKWLWTLLIADAAAMKVTLGAVAGDYPYPAGAVSALEAEWTELGMPTLVMPRFMYPFLDPSRLLVDVGEKLTTFAGTPVVLAHGWDVQPANTILGDPAVDPDDTPAAAAVDGVGVIWATGRLFGIQGKRSTLDDHEIGVPANDRNITVEQTFVIGYNSYRVLQAASQTANIV